MRIVQRTSAGSNPSARMRGPISSSRRDPAAQVAAEVEALARQVARVVDARVLARVDEDQPVRVLDQPRAHRDLRPARAREHGPQQPRGTGALELALADDGDPGLQHVHPHARQTTRCEARVGGGARRGGRGGRGAALRARAAADPDRQGGQGLPDRGRPRERGGGQALAGGLDAGDRLLRRGGRRRGPAHRPRVGRGPARRHDQLRHRLAAVRRDGRAAGGRRARAGRDRPSLPRGACRLRKGRST